jgi:hypothetical protein
MPPKPTEVVPPATPSQVSSPKPQPISEPPVVITETNDFGLYRQYTRRPRVDPEDDTSPVSESNAQADVPPVGTPFYHPFENASIYWLVNWFYRTSQEKSLADLDSLVCDAILATDFDPEEIQTLSTAREMARLDAYGTTSAPFSANDNWKEGSVTIRAPKAKHKYVLETAAPEFEVSGVYYHPFLEVLKSACQSPEAQKYHWVPFELFHKSAKEPVHIYSEIYNSEAMLEE